MHNGERIEKLRLKKKLSRAALADASGVHRNTILNIERGDANPAIGTLDLIADALGVSTESLLVK